MRRSTGGLILTLATFALLAVPLAASAEHPGKVPRIGFLGNTPATPHNIEAFRQGLHDLGYVEGQTIAVEFRDAGGRPERLPAIAAELVHLKVDVIVARGTESILAAKQATSTIPIVMAVSGDPVGTGLVASLAHPGGNITGLTLISPELSGKRLQLLKEVAPSISRVAVLSNPADPPRALDFSATQAAARRLGLTLQSLEVRGPDDFDSAFAAMARGRADALLTLADPLTVAHRERIVQSAARARLPAMYGLREFVDAGGLMSYGVSLPDLFRRAAGFVDKILKGNKPADLPVEQPTRFALVINLKTAQALGVPIPQSLLARADEVIQ